MPLTIKGKKIRAAMRLEYGSDEGDRIFYASENAGKINGLRRLNIKKKRKKTKVK